MVVRDHSRPARAFHSTWGAGLVTAAAQRLPQPGSSSSWCCQQPMRPARMDRAKGWGGEGDEQPWMAGHRLGHALTAPQPGGEQVELVALIGRRAGGAHGRSAVAAGLEG